METHDRDALENLIWRFWSSGDWPRLKQAAGDLLAIDPESAHAHLAMGEALAELSEYDAAERHLKKAIALEPDNDSGHRQLAHLELSRERPGAAHSSARKALALAPEDSDNWNLMGYMHLAFSEYRQARQCVEEMRRVEPESRNAEKLEIAIASATGQRNSAQTVEIIGRLNRLLASNPEDHHTLYEKALVQLFQLDQPEEAEETIRRALAINPSDADYRQVLRGCLRANDAFYRAIAWPGAVISRVQGAFQGREKWDGPMIFQLIVLVLFWKSALILGVLYCVVHWPILRLYEFCSLASLRRRAGEVVFEKRAWLKSFHKSFILRAAVLLTGATAVLALWFALLFATREDAIVTLDRSLITTAADALICIGIALHHRGERKNRRIAKERLARKMPR